MKNMMCMTPWEKMTTVERHHFGRKCDMQTGNAYLHIGLKAKQLARAVMETYPTRTRISRCLNNLLADVSALNSEATPR